MPVLQQKPPENSIYINGSSGFPLRKDIKRADVQDFRSCALDYFS
jgi:hypothetical protein